MVDRQAFVDWCVEHGVDPDPKSVEGLDGLRLLGAMYGYAESVEPGSSARMYEVLSKVGAVGDPSSPVDSPPCA